MITIGQKLNECDLCNHTIVRDFMLSTSSRVLSRSLDAIGEMLICDPCNYALFLDEFGNVRCVSTVICGLGVWVYKEGTIIGCDKSKQLDYRLVDNPIDPLTFADTIRKRLLLL